MFEINRSFTNLRKNGSPYLSPALIANIALSLLLLLGCSVSRNEQAKKARVERMVQADRDTAEWQRKRMRAREVFQKGEELWTGKAYRPANAAIAIFSEAIDLWDQANASSNVMKSMSMVSPIFTGPMYIAYYKRGIAYCNVGNYQRALLDFNIVIESDSKNPAFVPVYIYRAIAYQRIDSPQMATRDIQHAERLSPEALTKELKRICNQGYAEACRW